jgi:hypothetical protein
MLIREGVVFYTVPTPQGAVREVPVEKLSAVVHAEKSSIEADGNDYAEVVATVFEGNYISFWGNDEFIATVPVDPATHTATLQVTATTPGVIHIRAGEPTATKLNEVTINAT